ncbi:MAG: response regulator [Verrucomicrobiia bacterium]
MRAKSDKARLARIVIADDEPGLADLLRMVLAGPDREIIVALDGAGCFRAADEERVDVLLMDLNLPDGTAFELVPKFRGVFGFKETTILLMSGTPLDDLEAAQFRQLGVEIYHKPVPMRTLKERVDGLLGNGRSAS